MKHHPTFLADFHVHTTFSDGKLPMPQVIDLYGQRGFGAIAITDHIAEDESFVGKAAVVLNQVLTRGTFPLYMEILKTEAARAWDQYQMVVIPGFELSKNSALNHRSAHLLGLGISEYISADGDPIELIQKIHAQNAIAIAAHPVNTRKREKQTYHLWDRRDELASHFDAWEVASGPFLFEEVKESRLPVIASSDLHRPQQMRSWKTMLHCERRSDAILDAIKRQELGVWFYT